MGRSTALVAVVAGVATRTGVDLIAARALEPAQFAAYALLMAVAAVTAGLVVFGLPGVAFQVVPAARRQLHGQSLLRFNTLGTAVSLTGGVVAALALLPVLRLIERYEYAESNAWIFVLLIPGTAWLMFERQLGLLSGRPAIPVFSSVLVWAMTAGLVLGALLTTTVRPLTFLASAALASLLVSFTMQRRFRSEARSMQAEVTTDPSNMRWLRSGAVVLSANLATMLTLQADVILIAFFTDPTEAGAYSLASRLSLFVTLGLAAVIARDGPRMAGVHTARGEAGLWDAYIRARRVSAALTLGSGIALLSAAYVLLGWFGSEFVLAIPWLWILVVSRVISGVIGPVAELLLILGHTRTLSVSTFTGLVVTILAMWLLGSEYGAVGVALGTLSGTIITNLLQWLAARRACRSTAAVA